MNSIIQNYFAFTTLIEKLKKLERYKGQFYWKDYPELDRYESVADYTWIVAILILLFEDKLSQKCDIEKAIKMALIHDLPEIIAGDDSPMGTDGTGKDSHVYNFQKQTDRHEKEKQAAEQLFKSLGDNTGDKLYDLWLEYENQDSFEAKLVKALDRIEALLQVQEYRNGHLFEEHLNFNLKYCLEKADIDPVIKQFGQAVADQMEMTYKQFNK